MTQIAQQIEAVFPASIDVTVSGKVYTVKPFGIGKYPRVIKLFSDVFKNRKEGEMTDWLTLIGEHGDKVVKLMSLTINEEEKFFDDVSPEEALALLTAIITLNADVITKKLLPLLTTMGGQLAEAAANPPSVSQ